MAGPRHRFGALASGSEEGLTTAEDMGLLTAEIVLAELCMANQVVSTAGDTVTYVEPAGIVDRDLQRRVRREAWTLPVLRDEPARDPNDSRSAELSAELFSRRAKAWLGRWTGLSTPPKRSRLRVSSDGRGGTLESRAEGTAVLK